MENALERSLGIKGIGNIFDRADRNKVMEFLGQNPENLVISYGQRSLLPRYTTNDTLLANHFSFAGGNIKDFNYFGGPGHESFCLDSLNFGISIDEVHDAYCFKGTDLHKKRDYKIDDLKVFEFRAENGEIEEESLVIHVDPYLAYLTLREKNKDSRPVQMLCSIKKIEPSCLIYRIEHHVSPI